MGLLLLLVLFYLKEDDFLPQFQIRTNETDEDLVKTRNQVINKMKNLDTD